MIQNTAPLEINNGLANKKLTRRFLGNLFPQTCFEKKELQAYVKGHSRYSYKTDEVGNPVYYKVRQEYFYQ